MRVLRDRCEKEPLEFEVPGKKGICDLPAGSGGVFFRGLGEREERPPWVLT